jgi:hypothetical protein
VHASQTHFAPLGTIPGPQRNGARGRSHTSIPLSSTCITTLRAEFLPVDYKRIWAQGARAGDPLFFSSLYTKTCTRSRSAETADATYGRLPRSRAGRRRAQAAGRHRASVRGNLCGLRTRTRRGGDDGRARGAWRLDGGARRVETIAPSSPPPVLLGCRRPTSPCNAPTLPCYRVRRAALKTPAASNLRAPTRPMARAPVGNAKTHSTPSHYDGVEHKWLPSPPPPPPPWASSRRPRHHFRRRLRRAARCVGAFAAAPAQDARAISAIVLRGHELARLRVREQLLRSARASRRAAKRAGKSMANGEMVGGGAVLRRAWSRPQRGGGAHRADAKKKVARTHARTHELKGVRASTLKGCCARLFQGPQD